MSMPPPLRRGPPTPRAGTPAAPLVTGLISPSMPFVDGDLLTPVAFRFLAELLQQISALKARIDAAGIP